MTIAAPIHLTRVEPERNMMRFYRLSIEPSLFPDLCVVVRAWGRIGKQGRCRVHIFSSHGEAQSFIDTVTRLKLRKGYRPA